MWMTVPIKKCRCRGRVADCSIEIVEVEVKGTKVKSIAIEAIDPDAVLELVKQLGLTRYENLSYPAAIKRMLGWTDQTL